MDQSQLESALAALPLQRIAYHPSIGSTNDLAAAWAREGLPPPALVAADEQTAGRGRAGHPWFTPPGAALAFSLLLPPPEGLDSGHLARASGLGALAVCQALEADYGLQAQIKWPNDLLLEGEKVCGVLAEAHWQGERLAALILGIGINVASSSVPPAGELSFPATCLEAHTGAGVDRSTLLAAIAARILDWLPRLGRDEFLAAWESRLAYRGQEVSLEGGGQSQQGRLLGLAPDGSLRLERAAGEQQIQAGEIRLRPLVDSGSK